MKTCEGCPLAAIGKSCPRLEIHGEKGCESYKEAIKNPEISRPTESDYEQVRLVDEREDIHLGCDYRIPITPEGCGCGKPPYTAYCTAKAQKVSDFDCQNCDVFNMYEKREKCNSCPFKDDDRECWAQTEHPRFCRATDPNDLYNEAYIKLISDRTNFPSLVKQSTSFLMSMAKFVRNGKLASDEERQKRLSICAECPLNDNGRCKKCGCFLNAKTSLEHETCPENKW